MFNVLDTTSGWKIDFILKKPAPFHEQAFQRRLSVTFDGVPTSVISAEDLILSKLEWARMGESERQIRDAAVVLEKRREKLDRPYIEKWIAELGLTAQWNLARQTAGLQ
jgi:predicted nucleotidyltransferase